MNVVYLIDDCALFRSACRTIFEHARIGVVLFGSAEEFFEHIEREPTQNACVLTDFRLPGMNGIELIRMLRKSERNYPVILTSGDELTIRGPGVVFLQKPFDSTNLIWQIRNLFHDQLTPDPSSPEARSG